MWQSFAAQVKGPESLPREGAIKYALPAAIIYALPAAIIYALPAAILSERLAMALVSSNRRLRAPASVIR